MPLRSQLDSIVETLQRVMAAAGVPASMFWSLLILALGLLCAKVLERLAHRLTHRTARLLGGLSRSGSPPMDSTAVERAVGRTLYWVVVALAVMIATERLGLPIVTTWLSGVASYLPRIALAVSIWGLGILAGRAIRHMVSGAASSARLSSARRLGRLAEIAIWVGSTLVAIEQVGIEISFLKTTLLVALSAVLGGAAVAFGLGGQRVAANILAAHYVQKLYQVGQTIRLDGIEGKITRITETAVILESEEGEVAIPASLLSESRSFLVLKHAGLQ